MLETSNSGMKAQFYPLPIELMLKVLSYSEIGSVGAFLEAFPELKECTLLITDDGSSDIEFFGDVKGVARATAKLPACDNDDSTPLSFELVEAGQPSQRKASLQGNPIQLIEITNPQAFQKWAETFQSGSSGLLNGNANSSWMPTLHSGTTFVFVRNRPVRPKCYSEKPQNHGVPFFNLRRALADSRQCSWHVGLPTYPAHPGALDLYVGSSQLPSQNLVVLRVESVLLVSGLVLPLLEDLVVDFAPMQVAPASERARIVGLSLPSIKSMVVYHRKTVPLFKDIKTRSNEYQPAPGTRFELTNVAVMCGESGIQEGLYTGEVDASEMRDMDMSFVSTFDSLFFNGVPRCVLDACPLNKTNMLALSIAHEDHYPSPEACVTMVRLVNLTVVSCLNLPWSVPSISEICNGTSSVGPLQLDLISLGPELSVHNWLTEEFLTFDRNPPCCPGFRRFDHIVVHFAGAVKEGNWFPEPQNGILFEGPVDLLKSFYTEVSMRQPFTSGTRAIFSTTHLIEHDENENYQHASLRRICYRSGN